MPPSTSEKEQNIALNNMKMKYFGICTSVIGFLSYVKDLIKSCVPAFPH